MHQMTCRDHDESSSQLVNEPSEFEPLKFYCIYFLGDQRHDSVYHVIMFYHITCIKICVFG